MYIPPAFRVDDEPLLFDFIERNGFATLVSMLDGKLFASHVPLLVDRERRTLLGHVARANPHWRAFASESETLAIFAGPHAYISPSWYKSQPSVPTWNYAVVHVYGVPRVIDDAAALDAIIDGLVSKYESHRDRPWPNELPGDYRQNLLQAIVGFEMSITRMEGKFKLSQNRAEEDRRAVHEHLSQGSADEQALAALMAASIAVDPFP